MAFRCVLYSGFLFSLRPFSGGVAFRCVFVFAVADGVSILRVCLFLVFLHRFSAFRFLVFRFLRVLFRNILQFYVQLFSVCHRLFTRSATKLFWFFFAIFFNFFQFLHFQNRFFQTFFVFCNLLSSIAGATANTPSNHPKTTIQACSSSGLWFPVGNKKAPPMLGRAVARITLCLVVYCA